MCGSVSGNFHQSVVWPQTDCTNAKSRFCTYRLWIPEQMRQTSKADLADASINSEDDENSVFTPVELLSSGLPLPELSGGWRPKYQLPLRTLSVKSQSNSSVFLHVEQDGTKQKRELIFESTHDASAFASAFKREKVRDSKRLDNKLKASLGGIQLKRGETLDLLIEIVSGWSLPIADISSSDPFVICSINGKEVHRTKHISKT